MPLRGFFDVLKSIITKDGIVLSKPKDVDAVTDSGSSWVLGRFLSFSPGSNVPVLVNLLQKYSGTLDKKQYIKFLYFNVPKIGNKFLQYIKRGKDDVPKLQELSIDMIKEHYRCSKSQAIEYFTLLNDHQLGDIAKLYGEKHRKLLEMLEKNNGGSLPAF